MRAMQRQRISELLRELEQPLLKLSRHADLRRAQPLFLRFASSATPFDFPFEKLETPQTVGVAVRCERERVASATPFLSPACFSTLSKSLRRRVIVGRNARRNRLQFGSYFCGGCFPVFVCKSRHRALCGLTAPQQERKGRKERRKGTPWLLRHLRHLRHRQKKKSPAAAVRCCGGSRRPRPVPPARTASGSSSA